MREAMCTNDYQSIRIFALNYIIVYKLLKLDRNAKNHTTLYKLFSLDRYA